MFGLFITCVKWVQDTERMRQIEQHKLYLKQPDRGVIHTPTNMHEATTSVSADVYHL